MNPFSFMVSTMKKVWRLILAHLVKVLVFRFLFMAMIKESDFGKVLENYAKTCEYISKEVGLMHVPTF
jgi:hypothetical protein